MANCFLKNLKNPFVRFTNPFFWLLGCKNSPKEKNIDFEYDNKGGGWQTMFILWKSIWTILSFLFIQHKMPCKIVQIVTIKVN
jgi:hypothetical protein